MKKLIENSAKKVLNKDEQKALVGGICRYGGYPIWCYVNGVRKKVCDHLCD